MREAKSRGSAEDRKVQAMLKALEAAEVVICLSETDGGISLQTIPRDESPNGDSLAVIVASWLNSNLAAITKAAVQAKLQSEQPRVDVKTGGGDMRVIAQRSVRSITTPEGGLAKDAPMLLGPDGRPMQ
jgi:hypothetical protein